MKLRGACLILHHATAFQEHQEALWRIFLIGKLLNSSRFCFLWHPMSVEYFAWWIFSAFYSSCGSNLAIRSDFSFTWVLTKSIQLVTALLLMTFCKKHSSCGFLTVVFYWFKIFFLGMVFEHILNLVLKVFQF